MGFLLAGNGLLVVFLTIMAYKKVSFACSASNLQGLIDIHTVNATTQFGQKRSGNAMNLSPYSVPLCGTAHLQFVLVVALLHKVRQSLPSMGQQHHETPNNLPDPVYQCRVT